MSRLYSGSWTNTAKLVDNDPAAYVHERTEGRSWYELLGDKQASHKGVAPTLHNSTSLATMDLVAHLTKPIIKLAKQGAHYILPMKDGAIRKISPGTARDLVNITDPRNAAMFPTLSSSLDRFVLDESTNQGSLRKASPRPRSGTRKSK
jgi:hypothetical protein